TEFLVPDGASIMIRSSPDITASLFLWFQGPVASGPLLRVSLIASMPVWIHIPDTGRAIQWRLRVTVDAHGLLEMCGPLTEHKLSATHRYHAQALDGRLSPHWSIVVDPLATGQRGKVAIASGSSSSFENDLFGVPTIPEPGTYDLWFRVRVGSASSSAPEMKLGI